MPDYSGPDAEVDAFVPDAFVPDASPDGGPECECEATDECESAACVDGVCVRGPVTDGAECGELVMGSPSGVCVAGACVARGCGDGFVEPGPSAESPDAPPREACDDGNRLDGDACSASCEPTSFVVDRSAPTRETFHHFCRAGPRLSRERNRRDGGVDASIPDDAGLDAFVPEDSGPDAEVDAFVPDAFVPDASPDGGPECECEATNECESAACVDGVCVRGPVTDGAECGELVMGSPSGVCVAGACVARGCGDGFVEPGPRAEAPDAPSREACDDGNRLDGDACSASCEPTSFVVDRSDDLEYAPVIESGQPRALAVDGQGRVLLIYQRYDGLSGDLLAQRFDAGGVRIGDVITIGDPMVFASVAGLPTGGWVVAYERSVVSVMNQAAVFRIVSPDGVLGPERRAGTVDLQERDARVAALGDGFVVTFDRQTMFEERLYARRFSSTGAALGPEVLVHAAMQVRWASVASEGEGDDLRWIATWQADFLSPNPRVEARRFRGDTALDASSLVIAEGAFRPYAASARAPSSDTSVPSPDRVRFLVGYEADGLALQPVPMSARPSWPPAIVFPASAPDGYDAFPTVVPRIGSGVAGAPPALVGFVSGYGHRDRTPAITATVALPPDPVMRLGEAFDLGLAEDGLALAASPRGTWIAWIESGFDGALRLFLLPN